MASAALDPYLLMNRFREDALYESPTTQELPQTKREGFRSDRRRVCVFYSRENTLTPEDTMATYCLPFLPI